jgi:sulfotransferase 6B1
MKCICRSLFLCFLSAFMMSYGRQNSNFFVTSIPKSGTHLLDKCLSLLTGKTHLWVHKPKSLIRGKLPEIPHDKYLMYHMHYNMRLSEFLKQQAMPVIFTIRDPRDQVVSMTFWKLTRAKVHPEEASRLASDPTFFSEYLMTRIKGITNYYNRYLGWRNDPHCYTVKFEDLVGKQGGGSRSTQIHEIKKIARHCKIPLTQKTLLYCLKNIFGGTTTFRKGHIGGWRKYFTKAHKKAFKKYAGQLLIDLGYEKDLNW